MDQQYALPPKHLFYKLIDKDINLIVKNYAVHKQDSWDQVYNKATEANITPQARETTMNPNLEQPRLPPLSQFDGPIAKKIRLPNSNSFRATSVSKSRRSLSTKRKIYDAYF